MYRIRVIPVLVATLALSAAPLAQNQSASSPSAAPAPPRAAKDDTRVERLKADAVKDVESMQVFTQQMVDSIFSFAELGFQEIETQPVSHRRPEEERVHGAGGRCGHPDRVHGDVGLGEARDRAGLGHRRHPAGVAEARRGVSRADDRGRARPWRRPQLRAGGEHHGGHRREEDHGAREAAGHDSHLAGHGRRAGRHQGVFRARGLVQGRRRRALHARRRRPRRLVGRPRRHRTRVGASTRSRARRRTRRPRRGGGAARSMPSS